MGLATLAQLEKLFPILGELAHSLYFLNQKSEVGGQNNNNNLFKVITLSTDYKYTTSPIKKNEKGKQFIHDQLFLSVVVPMLLEYQV